MKPRSVFQLPVATPKQQEVIVKINAAIERLGDRRQSKIEVVGPLAKSKLAWKIATFQQAMLYRIVMLAWGAANACNVGNILTSFLAARALTETYALAKDFEDKLLALIQAEDIDGIDRLVTNRLFASRDPEWLSEAPDTQSVNILTFINRFDKTVPGLRRHYDSLSERCHPNGLGHRQFFSDLDTSSGTVAFSDSKDWDPNVDHILTAVFLVCLFETTMNVLDQAVQDLAELQHRSNPVSP